MTATLRRPHLVTSWSGSAGTMHRLCTCGTGTPAAGVRAEYDPVWMPAYALADAYVAECRTAAAVVDVLEVVAGLAGRLQLGAALALLAALAGSDDQPDAGQVDQPSGGPAVAPVPGLDRAATGPSGPGAGVTPQEPAETLSEPPPLPAGYVRVRWACGHSAGAPAGHDWKHRHPCPACSDVRDARCHGVRWVDPRQGPPAESTRVRTCALCGAPGRLYPRGRRCDRCLTVTRRDDT